MFNFLFRRCLSLEHEIACLDIHSFDDETETKLCAVGLWGDISARLLKLPDLEEVCSEKLKGGKKKSFFLIFVDDHFCNEKVI